MIFREVNFTRRIFFEFDFSKILLNGVAIYNMKISKISKILRVKASSRCLLYFQSLTLVLNHRCSKVMSPRALVILLILLSTVVSNCSPMPSKRNVNKGKGGSFKKKSSLPAVSLFEPSGLAELSFSSEEGGTDLDLFIL